MSIFTEQINQLYHVFCSAVVVAGGSSTRMGADKLMLKLGDMPVLAHTLIALNQCILVDEIVVVTRSDLLNSVSSIKEQFKLEKVSKIVVGGKTRQESSLAGVIETSRKAKIICIHDGARPFITQEVIMDVIHQARHYLAATPALPLRDTVKIAENGIVIETPDRTKMFTIQTPQAFHSDIIKGALTKAVKDGKTYSDDCGAVEALGIKVYLTQGDDQNIKITTPNDMIIAQMILKKREGH